MEDPNVVELPPVWTCHQEWNRLWVTCRNGYAVDGYEDRAIAEAYVAYMNGRVAA